MIHLMGTKSETKEPKTNRNKHVFSLKQELFWTNTQESGLF